jgi:predicted transcriptional regulator
VLRVHPNQIASMQLSSSEKYLLQRCNGARTVDQLAQVAPLRRLDVLKAIKKLVQAGAIELR